MHKYFTLNLFLIACITLLDSCKKDKDTSPLNTCQISTVNDYRGNPMYSLVYSGDKLIKATYKPGSDVYSTTEYKYSGNYIFYSLKDRNGKELTNGTITLGSNGMAQLETVIRRIEVGNSQWWTLYDSILYYYDSDKFLTRKVRHTIGENRFDTSAIVLYNSRYKILNGNIVSDEFSGGSVGEHEYTYYSDIENKSRILTTGYLLVKPNIFGKLNENLLKSDYNSNTGITTYFTYDFDSKGYVTSASKSDSLTGKEPIFKNANYTCH